MKMCTSQEHSISCNLQYTKPGRARGDSLKKKLRSTIVNVQRDTEKSRNEERCGWRGVAAVTRCLVEKCIIRRSFMRHAAHVKLQSRALS